MSYIHFLDSYALEAIYGTSVITAAGDTTYLLGAIAKNSFHPTPKFRPAYGGQQVGAREPAADSISKQDAVYQGNWTIILQNGVPLYLAMGDSATVAGPPHVHTITPASLPSITVQHDRTGTGTDWGIQYTGVMIARSKLLYNAAVPGLLMNIDWVAQDVADPGFILTSTPALPATATTGGYYDLVTATYDGNDLDGLREFELSIDPGLKALMANWHLGGVDMQHIPVGYVEDYFRRYSLVLKGYWENDDLWDDAINPAATSKDMVFKWQKSADDYIQITMTDVVPMYPETTTPPTGQAYEKYELTPTQISIEVKDAVAGAAYND
jgi:hypothetical protein